MNLTKLSALSIVLYFALVGTSLADSPIDSSECADMLRQLRSNYKSVDSYDVLFTYERTEDGDGVNTTFTRACRIASDPQNECLLIISDLKQVDNLRQRQRSRTESHLVKNGVRTWTDFLSPPAVFPKRSFEHHLRKASVANIFMTGVSFFPEASHETGEVEQIWEGQIGALSNWGKAKLEGRKIHVQVDSPATTGDAGEVFSRWSYDFDPGTALPTRYTCKYVTTQNSRTLTADRYRSLLDWCEPCEGIYLPAGMVITEAGAARNELQKIVPVKRVTTVDVEWLSVNGDIDSEVWDKKKVMDFEGAKSLCSIELQRDKPLAPVR